VQQNQSNRESRTALFNKVWQAVSTLAPGPQPSPLTNWSKQLSAQPVPQLSESWY
jgi:hypothetical protein